ncbi:MAG: hypothetical protein GY847_19660 [Proteobacteria bacterium]|nr:hypothetical protein [Pseudomonadota bacterium]
MMSGLVALALSTYGRSSVDTDVLSHYTFHLSDGQKWSAHAMKRWYDLNKDNEEVAETVIEGMRDPSPNEERRPRRTSRSNAGLPPERWSYPKPVRQKLN